MTPLALTDDERDLLLAGLFELTITYVEDDEKRTVQGARSGSAATPMRCSTHPPPEVRP